MCGCVSVDRQRFAISSRVEERGCVVSCGVESRLGVTWSYPHYCSSGVCLLLFSSSLFLFTFSHRSFFFFFSFFFLSLFIFINVLHSSMTKSHFVQISFSFTIHWNSTSSPLPKFSPSSLFSIEVGLDGIDGHVFAFGDLNSDKYTDLFVVRSDRKALDIYLWSHDDHSFYLLTDSSVTFPNGSITNVVPGDFNNDGSLDVLIEGRGLSTSSHSPVVLRLHLGNHYQIEKVPIWEGMASDEVLVFDADADLRLDLFGSEVGSGNALIWKNNRMSQTSFEASPVSYLGTPLFRF